MLYFFILFSMILSISLMLLSNILMTKSEMSIQSLSSFECGYLNFLKLRSPFSLRFFLISLIFLIFDIEIIFIFPISMIQSMSLTIFFSILSLFIFIFYGLIHEWLIGSLNWLN